NHPTEVRADLRASLRGERCQCGIRRKSANVLAANAQLGDGDRERNAQTSPADDPSKAVCDSDTHIVAAENSPQAHGEMADDEQRGEGIMGDESNTDHAIDRWGLRKPRRKLCQRPGTSVRE